ncbi:lantibiotic synthetase [Streptococcus pneumoniae]|nr:lantibiotic synthetase [Streptococcus pneumoniae]VJD75075.1 lantibiotic synthetase [Streptococcus pneumoniae]VMM59091.1 lantibiotic synthetase [Streptococcus pneumoniae]VSI48593.1 lantibiotic synthetase [Streptococcus pneumoniae]
MVFRLGVNNWGLSLIEFLGDFVMDYNFNLEHPFFFTNNDYSTDTSIKY